MIKELIRKLARKNVITQLEEAKSILYKYDANENDGDGPCDRCGIFCPISDEKDFTRSSLCTVTKLGHEVEDLRTMAITVK